MVLRNSRVLHLISAVLVASCLILAVSVASTFAEEGDCFGAYKT